jgi:ABC-type branched-subunit amino acid transport system substrate-binding protein
MKPWLMKRGVRNAIAATLAFAVLSVVSIQIPEKKAVEAAAGSSLAASAEAGGSADANAPADAGANAGNAGAAAAANTAATGQPGAPAAAGTTRAVINAGQAANAGLECRAGANGGSTDKGVSKDKIRVASTHVQSGVGSSFLGTSYLGMQAVISNVNSQGGICGRLIELTLRDDEWKADRGAEYIRNFIEDSTGYFALPVVPSSEGLTQAIRSRYIDDANMPVVGTDGMLKEQYTSPNVWPVATATVSTMRAMAKYAYDTLGARKFGIVYDNQYKFGREGAKAYKDYIEKNLDGAGVPAYIGIQPGQPSYPDAETFNSRCGGRCEFVAMLLEPGTAISWINSHGNDSNGKRLGFGSKGTGGAQPLFNEKFARDCGEPCSGMLLWTGYNPPIGDLKNLPGVAKYVNDVKQISPGVDVNNQFLEGSYLGMSVFVEALRQVGPNLTRARLKAVMDAMQYDSDLSAKLIYAPGRHYANTGAQAFAVVTAAGSFAGFRDAKTGFVPDPDPGNFPSD